MNLMDFLNQAKESLFRFEALQIYDLSHEKESFEKFLKSGANDFSKMKDWWTFLESKNKNGIKTQRVRLVELPLSDYTKYELPIHKESSKYGDDIRVILGDEFKTLGVAKKDFWLVDDKIVLLLKYGKLGDYLGIELQSELDSYLKAKDLLLKHAVSLAKFEYK